MAESFEKLDTGNILHDWGKISTKCIIEALNRYKKQSLAGRRKIKLFLSLKNGSEKNTPAVGSRTRLSQTQNWSW